MAFLWWNKEGKTAPSSPAVDSETAGPETQRAIHSISSSVSSLPESERAVFERIYRVIEGKSPIIIPKQMHDWVKGQFGSLEDVEAQRVIRIDNKYTHESSAFNWLRSRRPLHSENNDVDAEIKKTEGDQFCKPETSTPRDSFGRVKGRYSTTAVNIAKYDNVHSLIIFKDHNPLSFGAKQIEDYTNTALRWMEKASKKNPGHIYPLVIWNCLWKSGASIVHGHMQVLLAKEVPYPRIQGMLDASKRYAADSNADYFSDVVSVHRSLGLLVETKKAYIFPSLTPVKDKETIIIGKTRKPADLAKDISETLTRLKDKAGMRSFNVAMYMHPLRDTDEWKNIPVIVKIVDRGSLANRTTDIGGMELYAGTNVIETDPYRIAEILRK